MLEESLLVRRIRDIFKHNQPLTIFVKSDQDGIETFYQYQSSVELINLNNIEIRVPVRQGVQIYLNKDDAFLIRIQFNNEVYEFKSTYLYRRLGQNPVWIIQTPFDGKKIQERKYARFEIALQVKARVVNEFGAAGKEMGLILDPMEEAKVLLTKDISAGGLKLISKLPYFLNSELEISFELPGYGEIIVWGQVLRVQTYQYKNMQLFLNAIKFLNIHEKDSHNIDEFIFRKQHAAK